MLCLGCGFGNANSAKFCKECQRDLSLPAPAAARPHYQPPPRSKHMEAQLHAADSQCRQYKLDARRQDEGDVAYINRIDRESTPHILAEHERLRKNLDNLQAAKTKRAPGQEG